MFCRPLFVCLQNTMKSWILMTFSGNVDRRTNNRLLDFDGDPNHRPHPEIF